jgi:uncharacterized protein YceH (UPF0502 family)
LGEVSETLDSLARRDEPLIVKLERQAGQKEARYAHLLSGEVAPQAATATEKSGSVIEAKNERIEKLEQELENLRGELNSFRESFEEFKKQFE